MLSNKKSQIEFSFMDNLFIIYHEVSFFGKYLAQIIQKCVHQPLFLAGKLILRNVFIKKIIFFILLEVLKIMLP